MFRSTGSYEPDRKTRSTIKQYGYVSIHRLLRAWPRWSALYFKNHPVSIHRLLRAWPTEITASTDTLTVSIHRLLRAWPNFSIHWSVISWFRSTGSYEPDQFSKSNRCQLYRFRSTGSYEPDLDASPPSCVCILRFDPQALTSLTCEEQLYCQRYTVSIHRLLRAWPIIIGTSDWIA